MDHKNQVSGDWTFFETWQGKAFSTEIKRKTIKNETENYAFLLMNWHFRQPQFNWIT